MQQRFALIGDYFQWFDLQRLETFHSIELAFPQKFRIPQAHQLKKLESFHLLLAVRITICAKINAIKSGSCLSFNFWLLPNELPRK